MKKMCLKGLFIFCLLWGFSLTTLAQTRLPQGEIVEVRIVDGFTSKDAPQKIKGVIDMDVKDPDTGKILIRRGAPVRIDTKIEKPRGKGRPGKITLNLLSTEAVDGKNIRLSRTAEFSGKSRRGLSSRRYDSRLRHRGRRLYNHSPIAKNHTRIIS